MFSSSFITSGLTFRSLIHFDFFYGMTNVLISFFYSPFTLKKIFVYIYIYISLAVLGLTYSMQDLQLSHVGSLIFIIYLFLAVLGLRCCMGFLFTVCRLLIAMASLVVEHRL